VITALVYVTVALAPEAIAGIDPSVPADPPGAPNAEPLRLVGDAVRVCEALEWLRTVKTGLRVCPTVAVVVGGVIPVISSENRFSAFGAAISPLDPALPCV
jgi:hypothetical protein